MAVVYLNEEARKAFEESKKPIYRYCTFENALNTISNRQLWFSNPVYWPDPFEKIFIEAKYIEGGKEQDFPYKNRLYCMCVTQKENCEATWNAYSNKHNTIRFEIEPQGLIQLLNSKKYQNEYDAYIGGMDYEHSTMDIIRKDGPLGYGMNQLFDNSVKDEDKLKLLFLKRPAFEYEEEIRIILVSKTKSNRKGVNLLIDKPKDKRAKKGEKGKFEFPVFIKHVIPSIKIGPSPNQTLIKSIKTIFTNLVDSNIQTSDLYKEISTKTYKIK